MTFDLVLAKMHEDISWTKDCRVPIEYRVLIYDASGKPTPHIPIPDGGVESGAYCQHVLRNYDKLADITVFSQANPFDHCIERPVYPTLAHLVRNPPKKVLLNFISDE